MSPDDLHEELNRLRREMAEVQAVGVALTAERDLDRLLRLILTRARQVSQADSGTIWVVDLRADGPRLYNKASQNDSVSVEHREFDVPIDRRSVAGWVALTGETLCCADVYELPPDGEPSSAGVRSFDTAIGYRTRSMLAAPLKDRDGRVLGVLQLMNRRRDPRAAPAGPEATAEQVIPFTAEQATTMHLLANQAGVALANARAEQALQQQTRRSQILLDVMRSFSEKPDLEELLQEIMRQTAAVLDADRCTLFLVDEKADELWSKAGQGLTSQEIRFSRRLGIAGHVATTGATVNIPDAYADPRFHQEIDRLTGYRTRTILSMPVLDEAGKVIGVAQVLNKRQGAFGEDDERLLEAVCSQAAVALKSARLFNTVLTVKNFNESILRSIATGVVTLDPEGRVTAVNPAAARIFGLDAAARGRSFREVFGEIANPLIVDAVAAGLRTMAEASLYEATAALRSGEAATVNLNVLPLRDHQGEPTGVVVVAQDVTAEQRAMASLRRYVSREVAEQIVRKGVKMQLGGSTQSVAVMFSDIRNYTTMTESRTAAEIVATLNAYFSRMVPLIFKYRGMLDKYIGDAIMAVFGAMENHPLTADHAVWSAIEMRRMLRLHNVERLLQNEPLIEAGIGICLGDATYGNIGSEDRMDITVIGDTVNVASRLEGLTKESEYKVLAADTVMEGMQTRGIPWVNLGAVPVKGKKRTVQLYGVPDDFIFGRIELPPALAVGANDLPDIRAPLPELMGRLAELVRAASRP